MKVFLKDSGIFASFFPPKNSRRGAEMLQRKCVNVFKGEGEEEEPRMMKVVQCSRAAGLGAVMMY